MTVGSNMLKRNAALDSGTSFIGPGALLRLYDGVRPATGAPLDAHVLLAQYTLGSPFAPPALNAVLSPTLPAATMGLTDGHVTWWRIVRADLTHCDDGSMGLTGSGADITINALTVSVGVYINLESWAISRGNA